MNILFVQKNPRVKKGSQIKQRVKFDVYTDENDGNCFKKDKVPNYLQYRCMV